MHRSGHSLGMTVVASVLLVAGCSGGGPPAPGASATPTTPSGSVNPVDWGLGTGGATSGGADGAPAPLRGTPVDAAGLGPPNWVQPGMRLTYYGAAASIAQSYYTYVEDPAGDWTDPKTGKTYRRSDQGPDGGDMPTAAGEAYTQTDILAIEGNDVILSNTMHSLDLLARQFTLNPLGGSRVPGVAVDGAWVNPDLLRQLVTTGYGDMLILRGPYVLNGTTFDAVSFVGSSPSYQSSTYDIETGVLLSTNANTKGAGSAVHGPLDDPQGNTQLSLTRFVGARQLSVPGIGAPIPDWVATTPGLAYSGNVTIVNPLDPESNAWTYPTELAITFTDRGQTWATLSSHMVTNIGGMSQPTDGLGATGSTGLYWYDPATLATLQVGQLLDEDPVINARTTVEAIETLVTITTALDGVTVRASYDPQTGVLESLEITQNVTGSTIQLHLAS